MPMSLGSVASCLRDSATGLILLFVVRSNTRFCFAKLCILFNSSFNSIYYCTDNQPFQHDFNTGHIACVEADFELTAGVVLK